MNIVLLILGIASTQFGALELVPISDEQTVGIATALVEHAGKVDGVPLKVEGDTAKSRGLIDAAREHGIMIVPAKGIVDDRENPALGEEKGFPVGFLFLHNMLPGKGVEKDHLYRVTYTDEQGVDREIRFGVLTIRRYSNEDFRLLLWGTKDKPLVEASLEEEVSEEKTPVLLDCVGDDLEITWLGNYPCYVPVKKSPF
ncbi:MAG: hypothetical protein U1D30_14155 [Planctomycetota bacterium]